MRYAYALKAPAQGWKVPAWVTAHNIAVAVVAAAALLVIILLARAVGRLAKLARVAAAPVAAPESSGGYGKLLLLAGAGVGGWVLWERHQNAVAPAKAAPAPSPSPLPRPTVTQTLAPHTTMPAHFPLTGTQIVIVLAILAVVGYLMVRVVARNAS